VVKYEGTEGGEGGGGGDGSGELVCVWVRVYKTYVIQSQGHRAVEFHVSRRLNLMIDPVVV
jgi:hypothetical protein